MAEIEVRQQRSKLGGPMDYQTFPISSQFAIHLEPSLAHSEISDDKKAYIQTLWEQEQKKREGKLHEGVILSATSFDQKRLVGQFVPYKYYLAQLVDPSLKTELNIVPVSMNGITRAGDQLILAKRAPWVTQYPGCYELAPSGGIRPPGRNLEKVDMKLQLLDELFEETAIKKTAVKSVRYFTLIHDLKEDAIELCAEIKLKKNDIVLSSSHEYSQVMTILCSELESFTQAYTKEFVPLTLMLLQLKKFIS